MSTFPETRESLLVHLGDPANELAWDQFSNLYRPAIYQLARNRGLQDADAQDLSQQVLLSVAGAIGDWKKRGSDTRFRHWLRRVAKNAIINALTRGPKEKAAGGTTAGISLQQCPDLNSELESQFDIEIRRQLFVQAACQVRKEVDPATWQAFEMTVVQGAKINDAASVLQKSVGSIYAARSRVMRRLRTNIQSLEGSDL